MLQDRLSYIQIIMDPNRTSRDNGWIYGAFEPVRLFPEFYEDSSMTITTLEASDEISSHIALAIRLNNFNIFRSTDNLSALNLMLDHKESKINFAKYHEIVNENINNQAVTFV